jgi:N-acetylmuramoyl-L-alanine amidase
MNKLFISAGHGNKNSSDRGANADYEFAKIYEGDLTIQLRNLLVEELKVLGVDAIIDNDRNILKDTLNFIKGKFTPNCILLDIHWNAFNTKAFGTEVIIPKNPSEKEKKIAKSLLDCLTSIGLKSRGVKTEDKTARKTLGWMRPVGQNILIEVCFMDNKSDMDIYYKNQRTLVKKLALALKNEL